MTSICLKGDCLELMKDMSANSVDLFICDLPYGCLTSAKETKKKRFVEGEDTGTEIDMYKGGCPWDIKINLDDFWIQIKRLCRNDKTPVIMFCSTKFGNDLINSNPSWFRYDLVWNKTRGVSFLSANKLPMRSHEMIYVFSKKGANYNRIDEYVEGAPGYNYLPGGVKNSTVYNSKVERLVSAGDKNMRCSLSVINISMKKDKKHPTAKPIAMYDWLIKRYSNEDDIILDPTAGSFNSGRSALALNRNYIGMEMDDDFYNQNKLD